MTAVSLPGREGWKIKSMKCRHKACKNMADQRDALKMLWLSQLVFSCNNSGAMVNRQGCDEHILERFPSRMVKMEKECSVQWFSTREWFCPLGDIWQSGDILGCHTRLWEWRRGVDADGQWAEARDTAKYPAMYSPPTQRSVLAPDAHSAENKKPLLME